MSDAGAADPRLAAALSAAAATDIAATRAQVLAALAGARVFVAVTARRPAAPEGGPRPSSETVLLSLVGSAGGRAVPLFLDAASAAAFRPGARPVPVPGPEACAAALDDGAVAVLLDPPGAAVAVTGNELRELAAGRVPVPGAALSARRSQAPLTGVGSADPALLRALADALRPEPVRAARLLTGPDGPVLGVVPDGELAAGDVAALAGRVLPRLGAPELAVAVVPPDGPGLPVPLHPRGLAGRGRTGLLSRLTGGRGRS